MNKIDVPSFKLVVDDAIVVVTPSFVAQRLLWDYTFSYLDGSGYEKNWHPNPVRAKALAATVYRVKMKKYNYRAKWEKTTCQSSLPKARASMKAVDFCEECNATSRS